MDHNGSAVTRLMIGAYYIDIIQDDLASRTYILPAAAKAFIDKAPADKSDGGNKGYKNYKDNKEIVCNKGIKGNTGYKGKYNVTYKGKAVFNFILSEDKLPDIKKEDFIRSHNIGPTPYSISRAGGNELVWVRYKNRNEVKLAYIISKDWSSWKLIADSSRTYGIDSFEELTYIFAYSVIKKGGIMLHGVVMDWAGLGILVCAHSGVGKTTHTSMWERREGARIINGDKALCYQDNNIWYSCGSPWCGSSGKYINSSIAIKAIVLLERGDTNRVCRISPLQGAMSLIGLAYAPTWDEELMGSALDILDKLVMRVPVYKLYCRPDYEAVETLKQELQKING